MITRTAASQIKSIQRGVTTLTATTMAISITSVNPSKAFVNNNGTKMFQVEQLAAAYLSSSNTLNLYNGSTGLSLWSSWEIIEYE